MANMLNMIPNPNREQLNQQAIKLKRTKDDILKPYKELKQALQTLNDKYGSAKENKNLIGRYFELKGMIKEVLDHGKHCPEMPKPEFMEDPAVFTGRLLYYISQTPFGDARPPEVVSPGALASLMGRTAEMAEKAKDNQFAQLVKQKSTEWVREEISALQSSLCRICKKYAGLREVVCHQLKNAYSSSRLYPIVPRYSLLKRAIKDAVRSEAFVEVCHEAQED